MVGDNLRPVETKTRRIASWDIVIENKEINGLGVITTDGTSAVSWLDHNDLATSHLIQNSLLNCSCGLEQSVVVSHSEPVRSQVC